MSLSNRLPRIVLLPRFIPSSSIALALALLALCALACSSRRDRLSEAVAEYRVKEAPRRGDLFFGVATALDVVSRDADVSAADLVASLGQPDQRTDVAQDDRGRPATEHWTYDYRTDFPAGTWKLHLHLSSGVVTRVGYEPLTGDLASDPQDKEYQLK